MFENKDDVFTTKNIQFSQIQVKSTRNKDQILI